MPDDSMRLDGPAVSRIGGLDRSSSPLELFFKGARLAFHPRNLVLSCAGLLLLQAGWNVLDWIFPSSPTVSITVLPTPAALLPEQITTIEPVLIAAREAGWRLTEPIRVLAVPLAALCTPGTTFGRCLHALLAILWAALVWGIGGGAIAHSVLLELTQRTPSSHRSPLSFAIRFAGPLVATPLFPLFTVLLFAAACAGIGLVHWLPFGIGEALGRVLFLVPLLLALVIAVLLLGMLAAWPLIHAAIAAEGEFPLDALSRCLGYLNHRTGKYVGYLGLCWLVGVPCLIAVDLLALGVPQLASWGAGLAAPGLVMVPGFWARLARLLAHSWVYTYFWSANSCLYLVLRHDVDGTPWTEVNPLRREDQPSAGESGRE